MLAQADVVVPIPGAWPPSIPDSSATANLVLTPDNDDETAANMWRLYQQSGLPRFAGLHWNAVPWYVGEAGREKSVKAREVLEGALWLDRLLDLLPDLRLVVTMGSPRSRRSRPTSTFTARTVPSGSLRRTRALGSSTATPISGRRSRERSHGRWRSASQRKMLRLELPSSLLVSFGALRRNLGSVLPVALRPKLLLTAG
jgi:hypothetical protein